MANRANLRVMRIRYAAMAVAVVLVLSILLIVQNQAAAVPLIFQAIGVISSAILVGALIFEKWLWKTKLARKLGCPPDYSGKWVGEVTRTIKSNPSEADKIRIEVFITQRLLDIEWEQTGYDDAGNEITKSRFVFGEVIDSLRDWSGIAGIYEVTRADIGHVTHFGAQLVDVDFDQEKIHGSYCSVRGNAGTLSLKRA